MHLLMHLLKSVVLAAFFFGLLSTQFGCVSSQQLPSEPEPCSEPWFEQVESIVSTVDEEGHGPDVGSSEWRSAVEAQLGLDQDPSVPEVRSQLWCEFIDQIINPGPRR